MAQPSKPLKSGDFAVSVAEDPILWTDRKRVLGLPLSFTRYSLTANKTTSGIIWTFMGDYHSAMVAPRAQNRREALRYMCSVKGIEVPKDIEEMSEI